jgi:alpha-beta hydrolase superfamily lysophospholipase
MTPFRFGPAARQLYGVYHAPSPPSAGGVGVLVCAPLGQEGVRFHRLQRVLADRLSHRGVAVLRFDYVGSGESSGDDEDADLVSWQSDILLAHDELKRRSRAARVAWLGARLGASAAVAASRHTSSPPERLVLWDPVLDGNAYLAELADAHARVLAEMQHRSAPPAAPPLTDEVLGFGLGAAMLAQIAALRPEAAEPPASAHTTLLAARASQAWPALAARWTEVGAPTVALSLDHGFDWTSEEAMNTALVPAPILERLAEQLKADGDA